MSDKIKNESVETKLKATSPEIVSSAAAKKTPFWRRKKSPDHFASPEQAYLHRPHLWVINLIFIGCLVAAVVYMNIDLGTIDDFKRVKWSTFVSYITQICSPDWNYFWGTGRYTFNVSVIYQIIETFNIALVGTVIASILAIPFGLLASHKLFGKAAWISEMILIVIRTFPELLLGLLLVSFSGINAMTGIIAIGLHSIGMVGKLYSEQVDEISLEPVEAISACGARSFQKIHLGVMPQVWPNFVSVVLYRFDINIRTATVLGVVVGSECGIGYYIQSYSINQHWPQLGSALFGVIILIVIVDLFSSFLRKKLV
jgi:phosphonate transport system permease protein